MPAARKVSQAASKAVSPRDRIRCASFEPGVCLLQAGFEFFEHAHESVRSAECGVRRGGARSISWESVLEQLNILVGDLDGADEGFAFAEAVAVRAARDGE